MNVYCLANQKGGVGKTTTAINLAAGLADRGQRVLLIDCDPQGNATLAVIGPETPEATTYTLFAEDGTIEGVKVTVESWGLDLVPSDIDLAAHEVELLSEVGGQLRLRSRLEAMPTAYDSVVIDAPPSLGLLTINCLAASTDVIIPVNAGIFSLKGTGQLVATIKKVKRNLAAQSLRIAGVLATQADMRTIIARDVVETLRQQFGGLVFDTVIPRAVAVEEAHANQLPIFDYAPDSTAATAYRDFVAEVVTNVG